MRLRVTPSILVAVAVAVAGCGSSSAGPASAGAAPAGGASRAPAQASRPRAAHGRAPRRAPRRTRRRAHPAPAIPLTQTDQLPASDSRLLHLHMAALWAAITTGQPARASGAFFPEAAYVVLKAVGDPRADFTDRLWADFKLDVAAAHRLVAEPARLVAVTVPPAHWVPPNVCANRFGYYEAPNARLVYRDPSGVRSFGIASMISWHGVWYVIHLGAVVRAQPVGIVDDPQAGAGVPLPSSTC